MKYLSLLLLLFQSNHLALPREGGIASEKVRMAHRYHGILSSIESPDGKQFFYRKGQRCPLFTKAFEKWYEDKIKRIQKH